VYSCIVHLSCSAMYRQCDKPAASPAAAAGFGPLPADRRPSSAMASASSTSSACTRINLSLQSCTSLLLQLLSMAAHAMRCKQQALRQVLLRQCADIQIALCLHKHWGVCKCRLSQSATKVKAKMLLADMLAIAPPQITGSQIMSMCTNKMTQLC